MEDLKEGKELEFLVRNYPGKVEIKYDINNEPNILGFSELNLPFNTETAKDFPVCKADVSYDGKGYYSVFGWIQTIDMYIRDDEQQTSFVDVGTLFKKSDMPFFSFGSCPTLFDAPCIKSVNNMNWTARAFLVTAGNIMQTKDIYYVTGFEWGYEIIKGVPHIKPIRELNVEDWNAKIELLKKEYSNWDFKRGDIAIQSE